MSAADKAPPWVAMVRTLLLFSVAAVTALGIASYPLSWFELDDAISWTLIANGVFATVYGLISYLDYTARTPKYPLPAVSISDVESVVKFLRGDAVIDKLAAGYYMQMVVDPSRYVVRASDRLTPTSRAYTLNRSQSIAVPKRLRNDRVAVPVDLISKRALANSLKVILNEGDRLTTLSQGSTIAHSVAVIDILMESLGAEIQRAYRQIRPDMLVFMCSPEVDATVRQREEAVAKRLVEIARGTPDEPRIASIIGFLHVLVDHYPLVVYIDRELDLHDTMELSGSRTFRLSIERRVLPLTSAGVNWLNRAQEWIRGWLGVQSAQVIWPLGNAQRARSYHVEFLGPEGTYLARQRIVALAGAQLKPSDVPNTKLLGRYGQRFAHLYVNDFRVSARLESEPHKANLIYVASFFERPPGSVAIAAIVAWASMTFATLAAGSKLGPVQDVNTDVVSVMLALPTIAIAVLGAAGTRSSRSVFSGSLVSRAILLATFAANLVATGLYMLTQDPDTSERLVDRAHFENWFVVVAALVWLSLAASLSWTLRIATYRYFLNRPLPEARSGPLESLRGSQT